MVRFGFNSKDWKPLNRINLGPSKEYDEVSIYILTRHVASGVNIASGKATRVGLVATNSIRGGANRRALQAATDGRPIFDAWSDEPWVIDGAAVRVSLVCFSRADDTHKPETRLDGEPADEIHSDLSATRDGAGIDLTGAKRIAANIGVAFMGDTKGGPFDIPGDLAREWLRLPANPNGQPNADVLKPWVNGMDLTRRPAGKWIVDFRLENDGDRRRALRSALRPRQGTRLAHAPTKPPGIVSPLLVAAR